MDIIELKQTIFDVEIVDTKQLLEMTSIEMKLIILH